MMRRKRKRVEFISPSKQRTARSYSLPESKKNTQKKRKKVQQALETQCHRKTEKRKQQKAKASTPGKQKEKAEAAAAKPRIRIETKSRRKRLHSSSCKKTRGHWARVNDLEEMICELQRVEWDVILISETWRQSKEIWETQEGHIMVESGQFINKHGVAILLNKRWKNQVKWVQCESERVVAMSISANKQPIVLMSVYMPHSGYADHHVEKVHKPITKMIERKKKHEDHRW